MKSNCCSYGTFLHFGLQSSHLLLQTPLSIKRDCLLNERKPPKYFHFFFCYLFFWILRFVTSCRTKGINYRPRFPTSKPRWIIYKRFWTTTNAWQCLDMSNVKVLSLTKRNTIQEYCLESSSYLARHPCSYKKPRVFCKEKWFFYRKIKWLWLRWILSECDWYKLTNNFQLIWQMFMEGFTSAPAFYAFYAK